MANENITISQYVNLLVEQYKQNHLAIQEDDLLIRENNIENQYIKDYHGREILELLQNADDAYQKSIELGQKPDCDLEVVIEYKDNVFSISNTGTFFDKEGIKAIVYGNNSSKNNKYIGNKGIGFRSILNWADRVRIFSGDFNVEFSKELADDFFNKIKDSPQIKKQIEKQNKNENKKLHIPMLAVPKNIEKPKDNNKTVIEITLNDDKLKDDFSAAKQLDNIDSRILLFLPNIQKITIINNEKTTVYECIKEKSPIALDYQTQFFNEVSLRRYDNGKLINDEKFFLFKRTIEKFLTEDDIDKAVGLAVAVPQNYETFEANKSHLYSFFPLFDTISPFNCILHATYFSNINRNNINNLDENRKIIQEQLKFLLNIAEYFIKEKRFDIAYNLLVPINLTDNNWKFPQPFGNFELEDDFLDSLISKKLFLTVNNELVSVDDQLKINENYPSFFTGACFQKLLTCLDAKVTLLLQILAHREGIQPYFTEEELLENINQITDRWSIEQQIETFIWWNSRERNSLPNLLKTQTGKWITFKETCFFLDAKLDRKDLPIWVKIPTLDEEYQATLYAQVENLEKFRIAKQREPKASSRIICQENLFEKTVDFRYYDKSTIIAQVNSSVDQYDKALEFVSWLWNNYRDEKGEKNEKWMPPEKISYRFPCRENRYDDAKNLFFGSDLARKIFEIYNTNYIDKTKYLEFSPAISFDEPENIEKFTDFTARFGVKKYPVIETCSLQKPNSLFKQQCNNQLNISGNIEISSVEVKSINNLGQILTKLSTEDVVKWLLDDNDLKQHLTIKENAAITFKELVKWGRTRTETVYNVNYILDVFNTTAWIEFNGKKYSPKQILQSQNRDFEYLVPVISDEYYKNIAQKLGTSSDLVADIFNLFDFCNKVTDLPSNDFYGLLLKLPEEDKSGRLSKKIYAIIEQFSFKREFENSINKSTFEKEGKVFVSFEGKQQFYPAKQTFLPSRQIIIKKQTPIIIKGHRSNNENFKRVFGCLEYKSDYTVVENSDIESPANQNFQDYYRNFRKYALAYGSRNENIRKTAPNIQIKLVSQIQIEKDNKIQAFGNQNTTDEYALFKHKSHHTYYIIVYGNDFNINIISDLIEDIFDAIADTPGFDAGKIGELFRAKNQDDLNFLIKKEFGNLDVIDTNIPELKTSFLNAVKKIKPDFDDRVLDFEKFLEGKDETIKTLRDWNIDIKDLEENGFEYQIDLIPYYKAMLFDFITSNSSDYNNALFYEALDDQKKQKTFISDCQEFRDFFETYNNYKNSVFFDFKEDIYKKFGNFDKKKYSKSASEIYEENFKTLNPEGLYKDKISATDNVQTMIYFNDADAFNEWLKKEQQAEIEQNTDNDKYKDLKDVVPQLVTFAYTDREPASTNSHLRTNHHIVTQTQIQKKSKNQKIKGNKGELLAYNYLCEQYGEENIIPISEAFVDLGKISSVDAESKNYDLRYEKDKQIIYYFEVKTGSDNSFYISEGELNFAKLHPDKYKLLYVYDLDKDQPNIVELPSDFLSDEKIKKEPIIECIKISF